MATVSEVLRWVHLLAFAVVGVWAVGSWWRDRRRAHAWLALAFASLAIVVSSAPIDRALGDVLPPVLAEVAGRALLALGALIPLALLELLASLTRTPQRPRRIVVGVVVLLILAAGLVPLPGPSGTWAPAFAVFVAAVSVTWLTVLPSVAYGFWRAAERHPGVARRRLRLLGAAVLVLAVALLVIAATGEAPTPRTDLATQVMALVASLLLVVGATPPAWLRSMWRQPEELELQQAAFGLLATTEPEEVGQVLVPRIRALLAARGVAIFHRGERLASDGTVDPDQALTAAGDEGRRRGVERITGAGRDIEVLRHRLTDGALVVWVDRTTPFLGDEETRLLERTALLADLALGRAELLASERAARAALVDANAELESFVYSASHDLKSPLIAILGYVDVLVDDHGDDLGPQVGWYLERMAANGCYMEALIRDLLELSRIGRVDTIAEVVDLGAIVDEVVGELRTRHDRLRVDRGQMPRLRANGTRVRQLVGNLVDNAAQHGDPQTVRVDAEPSDDGIELVVRDDGTGIPDAYRERIFGVFERLSSDAIDGTGIGLAICRKVADSLGGRIWVADSDHGAEFRVALPRSVVVVDEQEGVLA